MLGAVLGGIIEQEQGKIKRQLELSRNRTEDSIVDALLETLPDKIRIAGVGEGGPMSVHLVRESIRQPQVEANLRAVARDMLTIFPPGQEQRWHFGTLDESTGTIRKPEADPRTVESIVIEILEAIEDRKPVVGCDANNKNRLAIITRAWAQDDTFKAALETVATKMLELFPLNGDAETPQPEMATASN